MVGLGRQAPTATPEPDTTRAFAAHPPANAGFGQTGRTCSMERKSSAGYARLGLRPVLAARGVPLISRALGGT
jgi:hypothetical protein